jgi:hypothetical protein
VLELARAIRQPAHPHARGRASARRRSLRRDQQFRAIGRRDARDLAVALIAAYQGISLITNTFRDPELMTREARRLERWIDSLS